MKKSLTSLLLAFPVFAFAQEVPQDAPQEIQQSVSQESQPATPPEAVQQTATVLFKSRGDAMHVRFHTSTSERPCEDLTSTATVYDAELLRAKLLPFIAKMQQKARAATGVYP